MKHQTVSAGSPREVSLPDCKAVHLLPPYDVENTPARPLHSDSVITAFFLQFRLRYFYRILYLFLLGIVLLGFFSPWLKAEGASGALSGKVLDDATGNYLEGAEIVVKGTEMRTNSERSGVFTFPSLPAGSQTLIVTYPGLAPKTETVQIGAGAPTELVIHLAASDVVQLSEFHVSSAKEGMAQAIALQKVSVQSKLVAAADQFGEVSEGNVGEYLKFLPGVSVDYNVNDARGLSLRGLSTTFTIVAVDGTPMAGTSSMEDTRRFEFEQIAMNNVETTELYKTVTPDIPASSTGGFVNFVTKSAFDSSDIQRITYNVSFSAPSTNLSASRRGGVWGDKKEYTVRPSLELNFARRVNSKLGVNFNYRLSEKYDDSPRTTIGWNVQQPSAIVGPTTIFTAQPRLGTYAIRSEEKLTHREAFATKVEYLLSDATKLSLSGQWNWYDLHFTQRGPTFLLGANGSVSGDTYVSGSGVGVNGLAASIQNGVLYRNKYGTTYHANGTLTHDFSPTSKASLTTYYSRADGQYRDGTRTRALSPRSQCSSRSQPIPPRRLAIPRLFLPACGLRSSRRSPSCGTALPCHSTTPEP